MKQSPSYPPVKSAVGSVNLEKRLQDLRIQIEETKARQESLESQKNQLLSPLQRQQMDLQLRQCHNELRLYYQHLQTLQSQLRHQHIREINKNLKLIYQRLQAVAKQTQGGEERKTQLMALRDQLVECAPGLYQLYETTQDHLDLSSYFYLQWSQLNTLRFNQKKNYLESESEPALLLKNIKDERVHKLSLPEKQGLDELQKNLQLVCRSYFELAENLLPVRTGTTGELPNAGPSFPMLARQTIIAENAPKVPELPLPGTGKLQVQFDLERKQSVLTNAYGLPTQGFKLSYQEYLTQGYQGVRCSYELAANGADEKAQQAPLLQALDCYLEAVSLDESRYEAYFGIGFLYAMVAYFEQAFYFLDLAYHLSDSQPLIRDFIEQVKAESRKEADYD